MSVRTGDRDEGKLTVIEASKNLIAYTYDRVHDKTLPKSDRWLMSKTIKVTMKMLQDKVYSEKRRLRKLLMREAVGELPKGTAYCSFVSWIANAERGNTYYQMQSVTNYFERIKGEIYDNG